MFAYTHAFLAPFRHQGDPVADQWVEAIVKEQGKQALRHYLQLFTQTGASLRQSQETALHQFVRSMAVLPAWADDSKMRRAERFFAAHWQDYMQLLGFYSLPYCYAAADGAQVLYLSERLRQNPLQRLMETAWFVWEVMQPNAFQHPQADGFWSVAKVRLTHAIARYFAGQHPEWQTQWGLPINQEDMAGTNLSFSLIPIRGMRKLGKTFSLAETDAFLHHWNMIGAMLGIAPELLPADGKAAFQLEHIIAQRQFKPSEAGQQLTHSLVGCLQQQEIFARLPKTFVPAYMRTLLGDEVANLLGIAPEKLPLWAIQTYQTGLRVWSNWVGSRGQGKMPSVATKPA